MPDMTPMEAIELVKRELEAVKGFEIGRSDDDWFRWAATCDEALAVLSGMVESITIGSTGDSEMTERLTKEEEARIRELDNIYAPGSQYVAQGTVAGDRRLLLNELDAVRKERDELNKLFLETVSSLRMQLATANADIERLKRHQSKHEVGCPMITDGGYQCVCPTYEQQQERIQSLEADLIAQNNEWKSRFEIEVASQVEQETRMLEAELADERSCHEADSLSLEALNNKLKSLVPDGRVCGCSYDKPTDVCMHHSPQLVKAEAALDKAVEALEKAHDCATFDYATTSCEGCVVSDALAAIASAREGSFQGGGEIRPPNTVGPDDIDFPDCEERERERK